MASDIPSDVIKKLINGTTPWSPMPLAVAAGRFASAISVTAGAPTVDAKSVLGVMGLGATAGQQVTVSADAPDANAAVAVAALITVLADATRVGA